MILIISGMHKENDSFFAKIKNLGHSIYLFPDEMSRIEDYVCKSVEGIICNSFFLHHSIEEFERLHFIQLTSAGYDRVPVDYIISHKIKLFNAGGVYSIPIAEYVLCSVLSIYKRMQFFFINQEKACWEKHRNILELYGKKVCIVGCGSIGTECAKRFSTFGCDVFGVDIMKKKNTFFSSIYEMNELNAVLEKSDIVVLSLPLTEETFHLFNGERLKKLKDNSVFINVARGSIVDTDALTHEIPRLLGVVLDVFETEPLDNESPLWKMKNVIISPHNSFVGENNDKRLQRVIIDNLKSLDNN